MKEFLFLIWCSMSYAQTVRLCLSSWITHLLTAVPLRARATFVELLCGCLISPEGWVTRAISAITRGRHWTTYYKLLERGSVRTLRLARALFEVVNDALPMETLNLVIDDTLIPRQSEKAPGSIIRHDHARKHNRPQFLLAQCWVTLGVSVLGSAGRKYVLPIVSRSVPVTGNRNKLTIALALVRSLAPVMMNKPVRLLFDAWFMRARLVLPLLSRKMPIIGQARCDTALFLPPDVVLKPGRGRPKTYGIKMTPEAIRNLPATEVKLTLYGKEQLVRLRTVVAMARFLKRTLVRAVWCEFYDADKQRWSKARLLLATETHCAGVMDADSLDSVDTGSAIESGCRRSFPYRCRGAVARQTTTDRWSGGAVATNGIYRTFFQGQFQPEVLNIHLPQTARRPKITGVAALSAANGMNFVRFTPSCAIVRVTQGWGLDV